MQKQNLLVTVSALALGLGIAAAGCGSSANGNIPTGGTGGHVGGAGGGGGTSVGPGGLVGTMVNLFDTDVEMFMLNTYDGAGNLNGVMSASTPKPTIAWSATEGSPTAGSIMVTAPFTAYTNQYVDVQKSFGMTALQNWAHKILHVRVKVASGGNTDASVPMNIQPYVLTTTTYAFSGTSIPLPAGSNGWMDYTVDIDNPGSPTAGADPTMVISYGVQIGTGTGTPADPTKLPTTATIYVDSFTLE